MDRTPCIHDTTAWCDECDGLSTTSNGNRPVTVSDLVEVARAEGYGRGRREERERVVEFIDATVRFLRPHASPWTSRGKAAASILETLVDVASRLRRGAHAGDDFENVARKLVG